MGGLPVGAGAASATATAGAAGRGPRTARRHWIVGTASSRSVLLGAFADIASDFGPDPLRRVREVIDGLIGDAADGEVIVIITIRSGESPPDGRLERSAYGTL